MRDFLRVLFTPACWINIGLFSKAWDRQLNDLMRDYDFVRHEYLKERAHLGPCEIWIANHPYGSFVSGDLDRMRPRRITVLRAMDKFIEDTGSDRQEQSP